MEKQTEYDAVTTFNVMDFGAVGDGSKDDTKAITDAWNSACGNGGTPTILFPDAKKFLLNPIEFDVEGQIVAPSRGGRWANCASQWIAFTNIIGLTIRGNGLIDGQGEAYWSRKVNQVEDDSQDDEDVYYREFDALRFESCNNVTINYVNTKDTPGVHFSIKSCNDVEISNVKISAPADSPNTDGINIVASKRVTIRDSTIRTGDDCIAINSGSQFFNVTNVACEPGHGISIGSLGKENYDTVEDIHVKNCSFTETQNGARIKTYQGGRGYARRITFEGITLTDASNPIFIDQKYCPHNACGQRQGHICDTQTSYLDAITLDCAEGKGCTDIILDDVNIWTADSSKPARSVCNNAHGRATRTEPKVPCLGRIAAPFVWSENSMNIPTFD
uniref:Polygalacturonase n=1 Tax=Kalanchoe fedtschenkoi TaxID=63787 RepID=A0A7N0TAK4_KALFE